MGKQGQSCCKMLYSMKCFMSVKCCRYLLCGAIFFFVKFNSLWNVCILFCVNCAYSGYIFVVNFRISGGDMSGAAAADEFANIIESRSEFADKLSGTTDAVNFGEETGIFP